MTQPLVSILMPAYQAEGFIRDAISSCQEQRYTNWELCIVDDGSRDDTYGIALDVASRDKRILVTRQNHRGCPAARNKCLSMSRGEIIARQDADDLQNTDRLKLQVEYLQANTNLDIVTCGMLVKNIELTDSTDEYMGIELSDFDEGMIEEKYLRNKGGRPVCASIVAWKHVYSQVGKFNPFMLAGSDGDWNFRAIMCRVKWGFIDEPLYVYRKHPGQISVRLATEQNSNHETSRKLVLDKSEENLAI